MKLSSYHSAFNLIKNNFDYRAALHNYCNFFDEVVVAVNTSEDDTFEELSRISRMVYENLKVVQCDFSYDDYAFDGKIKNFALQKCTGDFFILLDLDERIPLYQKHLWRKWASFLGNSNLIDCLLIPSINLCGDIFSYKDICWKFYLHKKGLYRGVWTNAKKEDGKIDITKSDTTEVVDSKGNLAKCYPLSKEIKDLQTGNIPFVFHFWGVDINQRIKQNEIWKPVWENRSGEKLKDEILTKEKIEKIPVFKHNLVLDFYK